MRKDSRWALCAPRAASMNWGKHRIDPAAGREIEETSRSIYNKFDKKKKQKIDSKTSIFFTNKNKDILRGKKRQMSNRSIAMTSFEKFIPLSFPIILHEKFQLISQSFLISMKNIFVYKNIVFFRKFYSLICIATCNWNHVFTTRLMFCLCNNKYVMTKERRRKQKKRTVRW